MKILFIVLGSISLCLGILGIFLPILPTTPFLLLTAACWMKGSERLYQKLMSHHHFGPYIRDFRENKTISLKTKVYSISLLWVTISASAIFAVENLYIRILLIIIAICVSVHISSFKTKN